MSQWESIRPQRILRLKQCVAPRADLLLSLPFFCCQQQTTGPESYHRDMTGKGYVCSLLMQFRAAARAGRPVLRNEIGE